MKTIIVDHLKCSPPKRKLLSKVVIQDYDTSEGIIREFSHPNRMPKYKSMKTRKPVNIEFV